MQLKFGTLLMLAILFFTSSCKKNGDDPGAGQPQYLTRMVDFRVNASGGLDTSAVYDFSYDLKKRITTTVFRYLPYLVDPLTTETQTRYYQGNDMLPYKLDKQLVRSNGYQDYITSLLYYDANSIIIKDSMERVFPPNPQHYFFTYYHTKTSNQTLSLLKQSFVSIPYGTTRIVSTTENVLNGNVTFHQDTTTEISVVIPPGPSVISYYKYVLSYDMKPNPITPTLLHYPVYYQRNIYTYSNFQEAASVNNPTKLIVDYGQLPNFSSHYEIDIQYTYNANGTPSKAEYYSGNTHTLQRIYFYSSL
jgi:hypothetical protein